MATMGKVEVVMLTKAEVQQLARDVVLDTLATLASSGYVRVHRRPLQRLWDWLTTRRLG